MNVTENMFMTVVICSSVASVFIILTVCVGLFSSCCSFGNHQDKATPFASLIEQFVAWRKIASESDKTKTQLRVRNELLEEKVNKVREIHEACACGFCQTCNVLKT